MIERYTRPQMGAIWSQEHKIQQWLAVEIAVCEAWARRGRIPADAMKTIRGATCSVERMLEIERETDHDVIAFLRATGETVGEASRFIHLGLTSSDVVDTGMAMQSRDAADLLLADLDVLIEIVGRRAVEHKDTITIGRSHGMQAEPTTFGLKLAVWYDELRRQRERLVMARDHIAVGQISGAVGTHAHVSLELENEVCQDLDLGVARNVLAAGLAQLQGTLDALQELDAVLQCPLPDISEFLPPIKLEEENSGTYNS